MTVNELVTSDVDRAVEALRAGGLVAIPTETVYGLAADATNLDAVARIFEVKGRPASHPLIVHIADAEALHRWSREPSQAALTLAATAWPGPLTLIVPKSDRTPNAITGGRDSVGIRVPAHPMAQQLLATFGRAVAAPSANRFGAVSPTTAQHVLDDLAPLLDPKCDVILDGGPCEIGVESTIVDTTIDPLQVLREGAVTREQVAELLQPNLTGDGVFSAGIVERASGPARASGMLSSHYAPRCEVRVVDSADDALALLAGTPGAEVLDRTDDLAKYARNLYSDLRSADSRGVSMVIAVLPSPEGLGHAVRDRLTKAAAPRPTRA